MTTLRKMQFSVTPMNTLGNCFDTPPNLVVVGRVKNWILDISKIFLQYFMKILNRNGQSIMLMGITH
ncbi:hypothetical protein E6P75_04285 [Moraxella osloensis]|uniref:Uncharacterized protein n=1 Tax=Faucicola osloensis TaxID=34062 RepID=A0AAW6T9U4_FAUOS|nr:hypothetical protein [Moraxella osloensis]MDI4509433.1 hypothetical protein [Moraxella osloensis]